MPLNEIANAHRDQTGGRKSFYCFFFKIWSGKTEALINSAGSTFKASAILKNTSKEKLCAMPGASMQLRRERLIPAASANCSWDIPRSFLSVAITEPVSWRSTNRMTIMTQNRWSKQQATLLKSLCQTVISTWSIRLHAEPKGTAEQPAPTRKSAESMQSWHYVAPMDRLSAQM